MQVSQQIIDRISDNITPKRRSLEHVLDCLKLVRRGKSTERGRIDDTFLTKPAYWSHCNHYFFISSLQAVDVSTASQQLPVLKWSWKRNTHDSIICSNKKLTFYWLQTCYKNRFYSYYSISDRCVWHRLYCNGQFSRCFFTENDEILWWNEGVYRIAKEIQLQQPEKFGNISLGIVSACCGQYLKEIGIESDLMFLSLSATRTRIDIVFDLYKEKSIKSHERDRGIDNNDILTKFHSNKFS